MKSYLDKAPASGLTEKDVFSKYQNFKKYFEFVYGGTKSYSGNQKDYSIKNGFSLYFDMWDQKYTWDALTDMSDMGRVMEGQTIKGGSVSASLDKFCYDGNRRPILESMFTNIRICNMALQNIHMLSDAQQVDIDDYKGQAYFVRAFCHFTLFKIWGRMPYLDKVLGPNDQWDIPRLSNHQTLMRIAAD
ncbi:MAG: RagB/SusD family nutrient uptake outer membrane protein, partial [Bacteroidota bacterium]|nr:RagB/SusD family nutrient uptake outer membrane protein [Bacteroidota bacterium]